MFVARLEMSNNQKKEEKKTKKKLKSTPFYT